MDKKHACSDSIVNSVIEKFIERSNVGLQKYGTTLDREDLTFTQWVTHAQEEHMDAILYLEKMKKSERGTTSNIKTLYITILDETLKEVYMNAINKHNAQVDSKSPDAGFDLFNPKGINLSDVRKINNMYCIHIDTQIICSMRDQCDNCYSYYLFPRSSISKTNLRLANSVGIIDSGYRGNIIGVFDTINVFDCPLFNVEKNSRLMQICSGDLQPFYVKILSSPLIETTKRGTNGFGSTGV